MRVLLDPEDMWLLTEYKWHHSAGRNTQYARSYIRGSYPKQKNMFLHHCVIGRPLYGLEVDHKNGNGLDNRRNNLRIVSGSVNQSNRLKKSECQVNSVSGLRGVTFVHKTSRYRAKLGHTHIGYYSSDVEAKAAYDIARTESRECWNT